MRRGRSIGIRTRTFGRMKTDGPPVDLLRWKQARESNPADQGYEPQPTSPYALRSGWQDLNLRSPVPQTGALPS